jgi:hypothetical protein
VTNALAYLASALNVTVKSFIEQAQEESNYWQAWHNLLFREEEGGQVS